MYFPSESAPVASRSGWLPVRSRAGAALWPAALTTGRCPDWCCARHTCGRLDRPQDRLAERPIVCAFQRTANGLGTGDEVFVSHIRERARRRHIPGFRCARLQHAGRSRRLGNGRERRGGRSTFGGLTFVCHGRHACTCRAGCAEVARASRVAREHPPRRCPSPAAAPASQESRSLPARRLSPVPDTSSRHRHSRHRRLRAAFTASPATARAHRLPRDATAGDVRAPVAIRSRPLNRRHNPAANTKRRTSRAGMIDRLLHVEHRPHLLQRPDDAPRQCRHRPRGPGRGPSIRKIGLMMTSLPLASIRRMASIASSARSQTTVSGTGMPASCSSAVV